MSERSDKCRTGRVMDFILRSLNDKGNDRDVSTVFFALRFFTGAFFVL